MNREKILASALTVALLITVQTVSAYTLAPDFSFTDTDGQTHTLSSFQGKVVLLEFFSTTCPKCDNELAQLKAVYNQFPTGFVMISISNNDPSSVVKTYKTSKAVPWIMAGYESGAYYLYNGKFCGSGIPQIYIIDQAGYIRNCHIGFTSSSTLITEIGALISPPTITVVSPNGGENWVRSTVHTITWSFSGNPGTYVKIELLKSGVVDVVIASSTDNDGSFSWTISSDQTLGTDYKIRISSTSQPVDDTSDGDFVISGTVTLAGTVLYNEKPVSQFTSNAAVLWALNEGSGQDFPINPSYNTFTGQYSIPDMPPGEYGIFVFIDDALPFNGEHGFAGDFDGCASPIVIRAGQPVVNRDLTVVKTLHLTSPVDNAAFIGPWSDPKDTYSTEEMLFMWDALAEASSYHVSIEEYEEPFTYVGLVASNVTSDVKWNVILPMNVENHFYVFRLYAYNINDLMVGKLMVPYSSGYGWDYRFRLAPQVVVESCSFVGDQQDLFNLSESVYVTGANFSASRTYQFSVVADVETWTDGMAIPERVPGTIVTVSSDENGDIPPTVVWVGSQRVGKYDIVVDVNGNGQYDEGIDALDDSDIEVTSGFTIEVLSKAVVESCSFVGDQQDLFNLSESVYVTGANFSASRTYQFSVVADVETWTDGMAIPERVPGTIVTVSSDENGDIPPTVVWVGSQRVGKYDIVVDVNGNGQYDEGIDALDDSDIEVTSGFTIRADRRITDVNDDGRIDIVDISIVANAFGTRPGDPRWNPVADVDKNSVVNIVDISKVAKDFGKTF